MTAKPFNLLRSILYFFLALLLVVIPSILAIRDNGVEGIALPMAAVGLWLLLFGRIKTGRFRIEGKQAFAVGGCLLFPLIILGAVHRLGLWAPLTMIAILAGLAAAIILLFVIKPTPVSRDRTLPVILLLSGAGLTLAGAALEKPADPAGVILVNGLPLLPFSSLSLLLLLAGTALLLAGLYGLIFGFGRRK